MKVTRDVIIDVWPVYLSGEASADTRALVDEFLRDDPEFARLIREERMETMLTPEAVALPPDHEKAALTKAKTLLSYRTYCLILSLTLAFAGAFLRHYRTAIMVAAVLALLCAVGLWVSERRSRVKAV